MASSTMSKRLNPNAKPWRQQVSDKPTVAPATIVQLGRTIVPLPPMLPGYFQNPALNYPSSSICYYYSISMQPQCGASVVYTGGLSCRGGGGALNGGEVISEGLKKNKKGPPGLTSQRRRRDDAPISCSKICRKNDSSSSSSLNTTVMIRNIPNQYRRDMLVDFLDNLCSDQNKKQPHSLSHHHHPPLTAAFEYDFVYLPMDFRNGNNLGYAFVNFTSAKAAGKIRGLLGGFKWGTIKDSLGCVCQSKKICQITWARIQGKEELRKHFEKSQFVCLNLEYLPVVFTPPRNGTTSLTPPTTIGTCCFSAAKKHSLSTTE